MGTNQERVASAYRSGKTIGTIFVCPYPSVAKIFTNHNGLVFVGFCDLDIAVHAFTFQNGKPVNVCHASEDDILSL